MPEFLTLKRLVIGYQPPNLVGHLISPEIQVEGNPFRVKTWGEELFKRYRTRRAAMADSNFAVTTGPGDITITLKSRDMVKGFDKENENTNDQNDMTNNLAIEAKAHVMLDMEVDLAAAILNANNYLTGSKITLSGTDQFTDETSKPIQVIDYAKSVIKNKSGMIPNCLVIPGDVFNTLKWHPQLKAYSTITGQDGPATIQYLADKFNVEKVIIADSQYWDDTLTTPIFKPIWSKDMVLMYVNPNPTPSQYEKSFMYRFRLKGYPKVDEPENYDRAKQVRRRYNDMCFDIIVCAGAAYIVKAAIA